MTTIAPPAGLADALALLAQGRDPQAWGRVVELVGPDIWRLSVHLGVDHDLADDAVQETLLQVRDDAGQFRPRSANADRDARQWILMITANTCLQLLRRRRRERDRDRRGAAHQDEVRSMPASPSHDAERADTAAVIRREVVGMPEPYRQVLVLHFLAENDIETVAERLQVPLSTAKSRLYRGLEQLRGRLQKAGLAMSVAALFTACQGLAAAEVPAMPATLAATCQNLIHADRAATVDGIHHVTQGGSTMATTITISVAVVACLAMGALPLTLGRGGAAPERAADPVADIIRISEGATAAPGAPAHAAERGSKPAALPLRMVPLIVPPAPPIDPTTLPPAMPDDLLPTPAAVGTPAADGTSPLIIPLPKPMFTGTPPEIKKRPNMEPEGYIPPPILVPEGVAVISKDCPVTGSETDPMIGTLSMITDGDKEASSGSVVELGPGTQWVQIDLKAPRAVWAIAVWHYHSEARIYRDVIVQIADDRDFTVNVRTLYNNDDDNSSGLGIGKDLEYIDSNKGRVIPGKGAQARFVRCWSRSNTSNDLNHYVEVEVYGK